MTTKLNNIIARLKCFLINNVDGNFFTKYEIMDCIIINLCIFYLMFPILLFFWGFLKLFVSVLATILLLTCWVKFNKSFDFLRKENNVKNVLINLNIKYILISIVIVATWVYFSGIGSFSYQNKDYIVRNAMFRDLINYRWPITFNVSFNNLDTSHAALVYYFTFWLPAAAIGKLFGTIAANLFLYLWAVLGMMLIIYVTNRYLQKHTYTMLFVFIVFSGLDILGCTILKQAPIDFITHSEWWAQFFQYSSDTTLLYWVFNQAIPTWLITGLILNCRNSKNSAFIGCTTFCYSPFATFGIIPFVIYSLMKRYNEHQQSIILRFKQLITLQNLLFPLCILIVYGSFYKLNQNSLNVYGFIFSKSIINPNSRFITEVPMLPLLIVIGMFLFFEVGVYLILLKRELFVERNGFLLVAAGVLSLIPFYYMSLCNDFVMRASIPALYVLMIMLVRHIIYYKDLRSTLIICVIIIGFYTPICEINRSLYNTFTMEKNIYNKLCSMKDILTKDDEILKYYNLTDKMIVLDKVQYFAFNYQDKFFFRILAKSSN